MLNLIAHNIPTVHYVASVFPIHIPAHPCHWFITSRLIGRGHGFVIS